MPKGYMYILECSDGSYYTQYPPLPWTNRLPVPSTNSGTGVAHYKNNPGG
jgi:predicted GIY-YIG superfamily endonuclease